MTNETNSIIEISPIEDQTSLGSLPEDQQESAALITRVPVELPAVVLYDAILGPHMAAPLEIDDAATQAAVRAASPEGRILLLFALPDDEEELGFTLESSDQSDATIDANLHSVGVIAQLQRCSVEMAPSWSCKGSPEPRLLIWYRLNLTFARCHPRPDPESGTPRPSSLCWKYAA
ncbi:MAG: hypothetical protein R2932_01215 [Caldilineaceae bacterium]